MIVPLPNSVTQNLLFRDSLFVILIVLINLFPAKAQLVEVGDFSWYEANRIAELKNGLLIRDGAGRYITDDFTVKTRVQEPFSDSYLFEFISSGSLYFLVREPYVANPKYLLKTNISGFLDTIATVNIEGALRPTFLYASNSHAYFKLHDKSYNINLIDGTLTEILIDLQKHSNYLVTDTGLYLFSDYILFIPTGASNPV